MTIEDEIKSLRNWKYSLQNDKDKLFNEYQGRYSELMFTIRNIEKDIRVKTELLNNMQVANDTGRTSTPTRKD